MGALVYHTHIFTFYDSTHRSSKNYQIFSGDEISNLHNVKHDFKLFVLGCCFRQNSTNLTQFILVQISIDVAMWVLKPSIAVITLIMDATIRTASCPCVREVWFLSTCYLCQGRCAACVLAHGPCALTCFAIPRFALKTGFPLSGNLSPDWAFQHLLGKIWGIE